MQVVPAAADRAPEAVAGQDGAADRVRHLGIAILAVDRAALAEPERLGVPRVLDVPNGDGAAPLHEFHDLPGRHGSGPSCLARRNFAPTSLYQACRRFRIAAVRSG